MSEEKNKTRSFSELTTGLEIIDYLKKPFSRLGNKKKENVYLYHYTNIDALKAIIKNKTLHLSQAQCMNDKLEYKNRDNEKWKNIYFASFMLEDKESIGMWSMYGQPWEKGIKIAIPVDKFDDWIKSENKALVGVDCQSYITTNTINHENADIFVSNVAYSNYDNVGDEEQEELTCGTVANNLITYKKVPLLTGYVKNNSWSYEKEVRLRVEFKTKIEYQRIALKLTDELIDSMIITPSPLFKGNIKTYIISNISRQLKVENSLFINRLTLKSDCDNCNHYSTGTL